LFGVTARQGLIFGRFYIPFHVAQLTLGCRMLHYTGIGKPSCLIFEKEKPVGETNVLVSKPSKQAGLSSYIHACDQGTD